MNKFLATKIHCSFNDMLEIFLPAYGSLIISMLGYFSYKSTAFALLIGWSQIMVFVSLILALCIKKNLIYGGENE